MANITIPFDPTDGFIGWIQWLADATNGWFFVLALIVLFVITITPMNNRWGFDLAFLSSSFGVFLFALPIYFAQGLSERALSVFVILLLLAILTSTVFKE